MSTDPVFASFTPGTMPEPAAAPIDAFVPPAPFVEALDEDELIRNLALDRRAKLEIPQHLMHPDYVYRFVNAQPHNVMKWQALGYRPVTTPELADAYRHLHAGVNERGEGFGIILMAQPKRVAQLRRERIRADIREARKALDPRTRVLEGAGEYARVTQDQNTGLNFTTG